MATTTAGVIARFTLKLQAKNGHTPNTDELKVLEAMFEAILDELKENGEAYGVSPTSGTGKIR